MIQKEKDVSHLYAMNGYMYACEFIQRDEKDVPIISGKGTHIRNTSYSDGQVKGIRGDKDSSIMVF